VPSNKNLLSFRKSINGEQSEKVAQVELAIGKVKEMDNNSVYAFLHYSTAHSIYKSIYGVEHPITVQSALKMGRVRVENDNNNLPETDGDVLYSKDEVLSALDNIGSNTSTTIEASKEILDFARTQRVVSRNELIQLCENNADLKDAIIGELDDYVGSEAPDLVKLTLEEETDRFGKNHVSNRRSIDAADEPVESVVQASAAADTNDSNNDSTMIDDDISAAVSSVFRRSSVTKQFEDSKVVKAENAVVKKTKVRRKPKPPPPEGGGGGGKKGKETEKEKEKKIIPAMFSLDDKGKPRQQQETSSKSSSALGNKKTRSSRRSVSHIKPPPPPVEVAIEHEEEDEDESDESYSNNDDEEVRRVGATGAKQNSAERTTKARSKAKSNEQRFALLSKYFWWPLRGVRSFRSEI